MDQLSSAVVAAAAADEESIISFGSSVSEESSGYGMPPGLR